MTCRHYRFQIPQEDADELRAADPEPCPVCDSLPRRHFQSVIWTPKFAPTEKAAVLESLRNWLTNLCHHSARHPETKHEASASAVSPC